MNAPGSYATLGYHQIYAYADYQCDLAETNNYNNDATIQIYVNDLLPDLILDSIVMTPTTVYAGEPVSFVVTLHNGGEEGAAPTWSGVYLDPGAPYPACPGAGIPDLVDHVPYLAVGASNTYTVTHIFDEGPHVAYALADYGCAVNEPQEANNYETAEPHRPARAPLRPRRDEPGAARTPVYVDTSFSVTVTVQNQGARRPRPRCRASASTSITR